MRRLLCYCLMEKKYSGPSPKDAHSTLYLGKFPFQTGKLPLFKDQESREAFSKFKKTVIQCNMSILSSHCVTRTQDFVVDTLWDTCIQDCLNRMFAV